MNNTKTYSILLAAMIFFACKKSNNQPTPTHTAPASFSFNTLKVNGVYNGFTYVGVNNTPVIKISFTAPINTALVNSNITFQNSAGAVQAYAASYQNGDSTVVISPTTLQPLTQYIVNVTTGLQSSTGGVLQSGVSVKLTTAIDSTNKFATITDDALLDLVQQQTLKYFYDFGHPVSGLARERNTSGDVVTTGGSGFGIMALVTGVSRQFITRAQGLARMQTIVAFLKNNAQTFHGAFPHWLNGQTGVVVPFSTQDDGADLVETAFLMEGLLTARQYFNAASSDETNLRNDITTLFNNVEWTWFQNGQNTLFWHWSPDYGWSTNMQINGWTKP